MTTTPAGNEPNRPGGPLAPTAPGNAPQTTLQPLTRTQKILTGIVVGAVLVIATLGFIGSYSAVTHLAMAKGFGQFAHAFPIAVDAGIIAFLALDLLLTWRRIAFPLLRYTAWGLTAATISFNAVTAWPDPVGTSMHGVIPILFVIAVEAARHAIGRIADITADKHLEGPNPSRWFLNPVGTFVLWRRQRLWKIRTWDEVLGLERERRIYIGKLRREHGRAWRRKATADQILVLHLATKSGMSITEAIDLPAREEAKRRAEADRIAREAQQAEDERRRQDLEYKREQQRLEDERRRRAENDRLEAERKALALEQERAEAERQRQIAEAEAQARLEAIARQKRQATEDEERRRREAHAVAERQQREEQAEADRRARQEQIEHARRVAAEQERAAEAARQRRENEEAAARAAAEKEAASRRAAEIVQRASANTAATTRATSPASASRPAASQPASAATNPAASATAGSASATSANAANPAATSGQAASASTSQAPATSTSGSANDDYIQKVVDVYQLLEQQEGKAPSDARLGQALGVSRSRAQQLRTAAIDAGHTELAKPMRLAS